MPARDGTGPLGKGSRTGRGMGNCQPGPVDSTRASSAKDPQSTRWNGNVWGNMFGRLFGLRRVNRNRRR